MIMKKKLENITPLRKGMRLYNVEKYHENIETWEITDIKILSSKYLDCTVKCNKSWGLYYEHVIVEQLKNRGDHMRFVNSGWHMDMVDANQYLQRQKRANEQIGFAINLIAAIRSYKKLIDAAPLYSWEE